jgi:hypothetical protein
MARKHIQSGDTVTLVEAGGRPVFVDAAFVFTDHVNDAALQVTDRDGPLFSKPLPIPGETGHGGFVDLSEPMYPNENTPITVTLTGTGAQGTVFYKVIR